MMLCQASSQIKIAMRPCAVSKASMRARRAKESVPRRRRRRSARTPCGERDGSRDRRRSTLHIDRRVIIRAVAHSRRKPSTISVCVAARRARPGRSDLSRRIFGGERHVVDGAFQESSPVSAASGSTTRSGASSAAIVMEVRLDVGEVPGDVALAGLVLNDRDVHAGAGTRDAAMRSASSSAGYVQISAIVG